MKKKRLAAVAVALVIILSCGICVSALPALGIGDVISIIDGVDLGLFPSYNETAWNELSLDDRRIALNNAISAFHGTPHVDDDFLSSSQSLDYYNSLIRCGNSVDFVTAPISSLYGEIMLERAGQADFGLGFYKGVGHSSGGFGGKFGDGTVADTLNDDFLDYIQNVPYSGNSGGSRYQFPNGYIIDWEPLYFQDGSPITVTGSPHSTAWYYLRFYLYDDTGVMINTFTQKSYPDLSCLSCGTLPFDDLTVTDDGYYYYTYPSNVFTHIFDDRTTPLLPLPWYSSYGSPVPVSDDIPAIGVDDKGTTIDFNINSDGVTYEGNTYNYNDDNSVTINGNTYHITVDPSTVNQNYYNEFLNNVINNYNNYYNSTATPFDATDILSHLKSIFSSLERFRGDVYTYIRMIYNTAFDGFNSMRSSFSSLISKLNDIIKLLKNINKEVAELTDEQKEENELAWLKLIKKFKDKVGWSNLSESVNNISVAFFGKREYSVSDTGDISVDIVTPQFRSASSMPSLCITFMGRDYDLFSCIGSLGSEIDIIKGFISLFLWVGFILSVYRSIPSILGGVATLEEQEIKRGV